MSRLNIAGLFHAYGGRTRFCTILAKRVHLSQSRAFLRETTSIVLARLARCFVQPAAFLSLSLKRASILLRSKYPKWKRNSPSTIWKLWPLILWKPDPHVTGRAITEGFEYLVLSSPYFLFPRLTLFRIPYAARQPPRARKR